MTDKFVCQNCGHTSEKVIEIEGKKYNLFGRKFCLSCSPFNARNTRSYIVKTREDESYCVKCQQIKNKKEFYIRKDSKRPFSYCISCQNENKELKLQEKLERIIEERNGACIDCGSMFPPNVYEFYKNGKTFSISKAKYLSLQKLKDSLQDHVMLCANCCRIRQWELGK